ncbi:HK97 family phage portal protein [Elusimicrobium posterum]|uniref:phage portal protein n=1 Tax=Elusimicrobium posterum TaxID=3116653 RepID=UPI003C74FB10
MKNYLKMAVTAAKKMFGNFNPRAWHTIGGFGDNKINDSAFLYACVYAILNASINGKLKLYNSADDTEIAYDRKGKNPLYDLLLRPSPFYTHDLFIKIIVSQLLFHGNAYILKTGQDSKGRPTMLIPLPPMGARMLYDANGFPFGFEFNLNGQKRTHPYGDIIHIRDINFDFNDLFMGKGRVHYTQLDREIIESAKNSNLSYFKNSADVGGTISYPLGARRLQKEEVDTLIKEFNDRHQGERKAHRVAVLTEGATFTSNKTSNKDMEFMQGIQQSEETLLSVMGVAPAMVGRFKYAPQYNTKEQQRIFYENTVFPNMAMIDDGFNEQLVPDFFPEETIYCKHDFSGVKALEEDYLSKAQAAQILAMTWPANEVRTMLDLPFKDLPNGNEPPNPVMAAFGQFGASKTDKKNLSIDFKSNEYKRPTLAQMKVRRMTTNALFESKKGMFEAAQKNYFQTQYNRLEDFIVNNPKEIADYTKAFGTTSKNAELAMILKAETYADIFQASFAAEQAFIQKIAGKKNMQFYSVKTLNDRVAEWVNQNAFKWLEGAEQTTFERMDEIVKAGTNNGWNAQKINKRLLEYFAEEGQDIATIYSRIPTMVNTEVRGTISEASLEGMRSTPFVNGRGWITTLTGVADHHPGHLEMNGQEVPMGQPFRNPVTGETTMAPGRFGIANQDINCLCDFYPVVKVSDEEYQNGN